MQVRSQKNDTVDQICWRYLGATAGYVEQTLEMNRHLAQYGPVLPAGVLIELPKVQQSATTEKSMVQLWD